MGKFMRLKKHIAVDASIQVRSLQYPNFMSGKNRQIKGERERNKLFIRH